MSEQYPVVEIGRVYDDEHCTIGMLKHKTFKCFTVELPWVNNIPFVSCIPAGRYLMKLGRYNKGGYDAYEVQDVPGRTLIKLHIANLPEDVFGCIGPGDSITYLNDALGVGNSRDTYDKFMEMLDHAKYVWLSIEE